MHSSHKIMKSELWVGGSFHFQLSVRDLLPCLGSLSSCMSQLCMADVPLEYSGVQRSSWSTQWLQGAQTLRPPPAC